jgi:hypothetical protein
VRAISGEEVARRRARIYSICRRGSSWRRNASRSAFRGTESLEEVLDRGFDARAIASRIMCHKTVYLLITDGDC